MNKRSIGLVAVVLVVLVGGLWLVRGMRADPADGHWATIDRGDLVLGVEVTGKLRATETSLLGPPQIRDFWQFKIAHMATEGDEIEAGAPVLAFDTSELQQQLQRQEAEAEEARKTIEKTERELQVERRDDELRLAEARATQRKATLKVETPDDLIEGNDLAQARLDLEIADLEVAYLDTRLAAAQRSAEATLAALRNQFERAQGRVEEIRTSIERMTRAAPRAGTVIHVSNWRDEKKKVGDNCWRGEYAIELPDLDTMKGDGQVDEADAGWLEPEQRVKLRLDAHPDVEFGGVVQSIWKTVQKESWRSPLKVVRLEIELDETDRQRMRPGMRFRGKVEIERVTDAVLAPLDGIFPTAAGPVVYRRTRFGHERVPVEIGRRDGDRVEVLDGLASGDKISLLDLSRRG